MPRSSGQNAMPERAMWFDIRFISSRPRYRMLPSRRGTSPMIDFRVVVLPAPLRPSKVTTSPSRTSKSTPCRMWLSPYQAFRPATLSMRSSQISSDHVWVARHRGIVAFREHAAACQYSNDVADAFHNRKVMLDHKDGAAPADAPDQFNDPFHIAVPHAGRGFVQQHNLGIKREGGGDF